MRQVKSIGLLFAFTVPVVLIWGSPFWMARTTARPSVLRPKPQPVVVGLELPDYIKPVGPRNRTQFPKLIRLAGRSVPEARKVTGAVWGIPPSYFDLRTGRLMGLATVYGKTIPYWPFRLRTMVEKRRVLLLIRRSPKRGERHLFYVDPAAALNYSGDAWVSRSFVRYRLGVDIDHKFDCVTMHLDDCVVRETCRPRSGFIVGKTWMRAFYHDHTAMNRQMVRRLAGPNTTIFFGDGGQTISQPKARDPKVGLMFYKFKEEQ